MYEKLRVRCRKEDKEVYQNLGFLTELQDGDHVWMAYMLTSAEKNALAEQAKRLKDLKKVLAQKKEDDTLVDPLALMREEIKRYKALHKKPEVRKKSLKERKIDKRRQDAALRRKHAEGSG